MRLGSTPPVMLAAALAAIVTGIFCSPAARAVTDTIFKYQAPKTGYFQLPSGAFTPAANVQYRNGLDYLATLEDTATNGATCFLSAVHLPHGAKMTKLTIWYSKENPPAESSHFYLWRNKADGTADVIVSHSFFDSTGGARTALGVSIPAAFQAVNNLAYSYPVRMCLAGLDRLYGVRVTYTYTDAGD